MDGCSDCIAAGGNWVHLRMCLTCGRVGCCDSSPGKHASAHAAREQHPLVSSFEPGEDWSWCFIDDIGLRVPDIPHPHHS
ncbi:UBP-type zinc finger domain-containing protein [Gordonia sp. CPCC 205333]|uniref:UBP-type zinc finger domain-containing protein n=1 Tax=Gordonia sp. CPCC 205333 TaxID=3140790 RepID=UPI003AF3460B